MPAITITSASGPLTLTAATQNFAVPVLIRSTGTVTGTSYGISGDASAAWSIANDGRVTASSGSGISLADGGWITNGTSAATAAIFSSGIGVRIAGAAGTITNAGTIISTANYGISLAAGGTVSNTASTSTISGTTGLMISNAAGVVTNDGTITGRNSIGILLADGGQITNGVSLTTAMVTAANSAIEIYGAAGTIVNRGSITTSGNHAGITLGAGGSISNLGTASRISAEGTGIVAGVDAATIVNQGGIAGGIGVDLAAGGSITNSGTASRIIGTGFTAIELGASGTVINQGSIGASTIGGAIGVSINGAGSVANSGVITGGSEPGGGVTLAGGGQVSNSAASFVPMISANGFGVMISGAAGTVINTGTIHGGTQGISLTAGGTVTNSGTAALVIGNNLGAVAINGGTGTVTNEGTLTGSDGGGIVLSDGGGVTNGATSTSALVQGYTIGIGIYGALGTIVNQGTVIGMLNHNAVRPADGGTLSNLGTAALISTGQGTAVAGGAVEVDVVNEGAIVGGAGLYFAAAGTVTNSGSLSRIVGTLDSGIILDVGGSVSNQGSIGGAAIGVNLNGGLSTLSNSGTISGTTAVSFGNFAGNRLVLHEGATFVGNVVGGSRPGTIELAADASAGTIAGIGSTITGFENVVVDAGAVWNIGTTTGELAFVLPGASLTAAGNALNANTTFDLSDPGAATLTLTGLEAASHFEPLLNGLSFDDTLVLPGKTFAAGDTAVYSAESRTIEILDGTNVVFTFNHVELKATTQPPAFVIGTSSIEYVACFLRGTGITTPGGSRPVEALRIGDLVVTHGGARRPVKWIGRRGYDTCLTAENPQLRPVRLRGGALAPGQPRRDLLLSPLHAILAGGALVPAAALVNGVSSLREPVGGDIEYFHVELDTHDLIEAEGVAAETFIDQNSRSQFQNAAEFATLYPDAEACAPNPRPRLEQGAELEAIRARLAARAGTIPATAPGMPFTGLPYHVQGHVERIANGCIEGWAFDPVNPERPVELELLLDGVAIVWLLANRYRADLDRAGLGGGSCAFRATLPAGAHRSRLQLRSSGGAPLPHAA